MSRVETGIKRVRYELSKWLMILKNPDVFTEQVKEDQKVNWFQFMLLVLFWSIFNCESVGDTAVGAACLKLIDSMVIMVLYELFVVKICSGRSNIYSAINMSIYIHFFLLLIDNSLLGDVWRIIIYPFAHIYAATLHYNILINWHKCKSKKVGNMMVAEVSLLVIGYVDVLLAWAGVYMVYSSKVLYYS